MNQKYVVVDLETTGNAPKKGDKIIQFAAVVVENGQIIDQFSSFVNPNREIPSFIQELTGITLADVANAPPFSELAPYIIGILDDAIFVAHNVLFDLSFLQVELERCGYEMFLGSTVDTVEMAKIVLPCSESYKLEYLANQQGLNHDRPHQADSDALVTAELLIKLLQGIQTLPKPTIKALYRLSLSMKSDLNEVFREVLQKHDSSSQPWRPDLDVYRGLALTKKTDSANILFSKDRELKFWIESSNQNEMKDYILSLLQNGSVGMIEEQDSDSNGWYLNPIINYVLNNSSSVLITTNSEKKLKRIENEIAGIPASIGCSVIKPKENYLSLAKFEQSLRNRENHYDSALTKMQILVWLTQTHTGDKSELNLSSGGQLYWNEVEVNANLVGALGKPWHDRDFYQSSIRNAKQAKIILTNYACLIEECSQGLLTDIPIYLIDEANQFPPYLDKKLGDSLHYTDVKVLLNKIGSLETNHILFQLCLLRKQLIGNSQSIGVQENRIMNDLVYEFEQFFQLLVQYGGSKVVEKEGTLTYSCSLPNNRQERSWQAVVYIAERLNDHLTKMVQGLSGLMDLLQTVPIDKWKRSQLNILDDGLRILPELTRIKGILQRLFVNQNQKLAVWMEWNTKANKNSVEVFAVPLDKHEWLQTHLYANRKSVIYIANSLTVNQSFDYMSSQFGIQDEVSTRIVNHSRQSDRVKLAIMNDLPDVKTISLTEYTTLAAYHIIDIVEITAKRIVVLFNTQEMLKESFKVLKTLEGMSGFSVLAQGITNGTPSKLAKRFVGIEKALLLVTYQDWNDLELATNAYTCIVMVRLPFRSLQNPLVRAKLAYQKEHGQNGFTTFSLPEAARTFKQTIDNLNRVCQTNSLCIVLDNRLLTADYRSFFLNSLRHVEIFSTSIDQLEEQIEANLLK